MEVQAYFVGKHGREKLHFKFINDSAEMCRLKFCTVYFDLSTLIAGSQFHQQSQQWHFKPVFCRCCCHPPNWRHRESKEASLWCASTSGHLACICGLLCLARILFILVSPAQSPIYLLCFLIIVYFDMFSRVLRIYNECFHFESFQRRLQRINKAFVASI